MNPTDIKNKMKTNLSGRVAPLFAACAVFLVCLLATVVATEAFTREIEQRLYGNLSVSAQSIQNVLVRRAGSYELVLVSSANIFNLQEELSRGDWSEFVAGMEIQERYPGTLTIGYSELLNYNRLRSHIEEQKKEIDDYEVWPSGVRKEYAVVTYVNPATELNNGALGFDMYSDVSRRAAMQKARETGSAAITKPLSLTSDTQNQSQPGLIIFNPVYSRSNLTNTDDRRRYHTGFTFAVLRSNDLIRGLFGNTYKAGDTSFKISYVADDESQELYKSPTYNDVLGDQHVANVVNVPFFDIFLRIDVAARSGEIFFSPIRVFLIGFLLSLLTSVIIFALLQRRLSQLRNRHNKAVEKSKHELLALASHQLRTPATGVKQYVGMVLQGYSGKISDEQNTLLNKAYKSNENQLKIINELLYVAKADANQLYIEPEPTNITTAVKESVDALALNAKAKDIKLDFRTKRKIIAEIDPRYVSMAVNNLISNAIKYSHPGGSVTINVGLSVDQIRISVKDNGVGIKPHQMPELFKKFSRLPNMYSQKEGGTGLGLFLAKRIAKAHDGDLEVKSAPGKSTVFTLIFPKKVKSSLKRNMSNRIGIKRKVSLRDEEYK